MWHFSRFLFFGCSTIYSCSGHLGPHAESDYQTPKTLETDTSRVNIQIPSFIMDSTLVDVQTINHNIVVSLKYATTDNFMHQKLYKHITKAYLKKDVAERLASCQNYLTNIDSSLHLLIYDAVRPLSVQWEMWRALDTIPVSKRVKFVSNPKNKSLHNYGAAVDLTICRSDRTPLDMGAEFDDIRPIAYPINESIFLKNGGLTKKQLDNRKLLRSVMRTEGFRNLETEWWHFNACSRSEAHKKYVVIEKE